MLARGYQGRKARTLKGGWKVDSWIKMKQHISSDDNGIEKDLENLPLNFQ